MIQDAGRRSLALNRTPVSATTSIGVSLARGESSFEDAACGNTSRRSWLPAASTEGSIDAAPSSKSSMTDGVASIDGAASVVADPASRFTRNSTTAITAATTSKTAIGRVRTTMDRVRAYRIARSRLRARRRGPRRGQHRPLANRGPGRRRLPQRQAPAEGVREHALAEVVLVVPLDLGHREQAV